MLDNYNENIVPYERIKAKLKLQSRWESVPENAFKFEFDSNQFYDIHYIPQASIIQKLDSVSVKEFLNQQRLNEVTECLAFNDTHKDYNEFSCLQFLNSNSNTSNGVGGTSGTGVYSTSLSHNEEIKLRRQKNLEESLSLLDTQEHKVNFDIIPSDLKIQRRERNFLIPVDTYPNYNFMALLIGPRGSNHKQLELLSGAQINIRGRNTQSNARLNVYNETTYSQEPLHVHVTADTQEKVDKAASFLEIILDPTHPSHEEFRQRGLQLLSKYNAIEISSASTTKLKAKVKEMALNAEKAVCTVCGDIGHYGYDCPNTNSSNYEKVNIKCGICHCYGHVTSDCLMKQPDMNENEINEMIIRQFKESNINQTEQGQSQTIFNSIYHTKNRGNLY